MRLSTRALARWWTALRPATVVFVPAALVCHSVWRELPDYLLRTGCRADGKIVYACVTYAILSLIYSAINVPYCAMPGALTLDPRERHSLQSGALACRLSAG